MSAPLRVVLDTNVVLSALVFGGGTAGQVRRAWQSGLITPLASAATMQELLRVLAYPKFRLTTAEQHELLGDYVPFVETVHIPTPPPVVPHCRDPKDTPFLHLAVAGAAEVLVSGDMDLLALANAFAQQCACPICDVTSFLARYKPP
ncbi:MAG: putative toxin-antitoxin system toxin component, PIN family [Rhodoferax sp.]|nr:putative toxin-antitoxin system toxin component, PIN family [Rhodoferax sp.]